MDRPNAHKPVLSHAELEAQIAEMHVQKLELAAEKRALRQEKLNIEERLQHITPRLKDIEHQRISLRRREKAAKALAYDALRDHQSSGSSVTKQPTVEASFLAQVLEHVDLRFPYLTQEPLSGLSLTSAKRKRDELQGVLCYVVRAKHPTSTLGSELQDDSEGRPSMTSFRSGEAANVKVSSHLAVLIIDIMH
jgi:hypothetical protein